MLADNGPSGPICYLFTTRGGLRVVALLRSPARAESNQLRKKRWKARHRVPRTDINAVHVTIRTKEAEVPSEFPPARLFLDDIEEIVRILLEATENRNAPSRQRADRLARNIADVGQSPPLALDFKTTVTLAIKDQVCDQVRELSKVAKKTSELSLTIASHPWGPDTSLTFSKSGARLRALAFTRDEQLNIFHKLAPVFKRRNLWLATLNHRYSNLFGVLTLALWFCAAIPALTLLNKQVPTTRAILVGLPAAAIIITVLATGSNHNSIVMRRFSEPSPLSQGLPQKILLVVISSALTFLLTLLGFYLKHKYWP